MFQKIKWIISWILIGMAVLLNGNIIKKASAEEVPTRTPTPTLSRYVVIFDYTNPKTNQNYTFTSLDQTNLNKVYGPLDKEDFGYMTNTKEEIAGIEKFCSKTSTRFITRETDENDTIDVWVLLPYEEPVTTISEPVTTKFSKEPVITKSSKSVTISTITQATNYSFPTGYSIIETETQTITKSTKPNSKSVTTPDFTYSYKGVTIQSNEQTRKDKFSQEVALLLKNLPKAASQANHFSPNGNYFFFHSTFKLKLPKATDTISANAVSNTASVQIITGPPEHLFLAAELPVAVQQGTSGLNNFLGEVGTPPGQKPSQFDLSLDFSFGDVWSPQFDPILHVFAKFSDSPLDEYGIGAGFNLPSIPIGDLLNTSQFTVTENLLREQSNGSASWGWATFIGYDLLEVSNWFSTTTGSSANTGSGNNNNNTTKNTKSTDKNSTDN